MGAVAQAAGLSRPTLYLSFPDKEEIFCAVVEMMVAKKFAAIRDGLAKQSSLDAKLCFACNAWGVEGFELVLANPDAMDLFDLGFAPVRKSYAAFEEILAGILDEPLSKTGLDVQPLELARTIVFGMKGFKDIARNGAEMRRMIATRDRLKPGGAIDFQPLLDWG
jgi:AcrR family transcriptional regulator